MGGVTHVDEERNLSKSVDQLGENAEPLLCVRVGKGSNRVEQSVEIDLAVFVTVVVIAQVKTLGAWQDSGSHEGLLRLQSSDPKSLQRLTIQFDPQTGFVRYAQV